MNSGGTESWLGIFWGCAALLVLYKAWRGWRLGLVRQALAIVALIASYVVAIYCGFLAVPLLRGVGLPDKILSIAAGAIMGLAVYVLISLVGSLILKRTSHQSLGIVRWLYGGGGAVLGAIVGLVMVWVALIGVRFLGTIAQSSTQPAHRTGTHSRPGHTARTGANTQKTPAPADPLVSGLSDLKSALDKSAVAPVIERIDPVPDAVYANMSKLSQVLSREDGMTRLASYPGLKDMANNPKLRALAQDPEISRAAARGDFLEMLHNPKVIEAANDPEIMRTVMSVDIQKALDYALGSSENRLPAPDSR